MTFSHFMKSLAPAAKLITTRSFNTSKLVYSAQQSPLYQLRQKTGLAYHLCREALVKYDNNVNEAEAWLRAQELAHGLQKATKVKGRLAKEGLIGLATRQDSSIVSVLEVNCETDFVAKNQIFRDFTMGLTEHLSRTTQNCEVLHVEEQKFVQELKPSKEELDKMNEQVVPLISKLGENIKIHRASHFRVLEDNVHIFGQVHAQADKIKTNNFELMTGRFAALVALQRLDSRIKDNLKPIGDRLCQHVIGYSPNYIELPENIRKHLESAEKERLESLKNEKSDCEAEELSDSEEEQSNQGSRDDWPSIMDQSLIMSDGDTVREFCDENKISIVYFNRFECGLGS